MKTNGHEKVINLMNEAIDSAQCLINDSIGFLLDKDIDRAIEKLTLASAKLDMNDNIEENDWKIGDFVWALNPVPPRGKFAGTIEEFPDIENVKVKLIAGPDRFGQIICVTRKSIFKRDVR